MSEAQAIISKNLERSKLFERAQDILYTSQLHEAARLLRGSAPERAGAFFRVAFEKSPVSREMLYLCTLICKEPDHAEKVRESILVSCTRNPLSRSAATVMCRDVPSASLIEGSDFKGVCEAVANDTADFGILPMCSSQDGYLPTFSKLLKTYDLKICKTVRLSKPDSDEELQFALLSKDLIIRKSAAFAAFSFVGDNESTLPRLVSTLCDGGCSVRSIISSPLEYNMDRFEHRVEILLNGMSPYVLMYFFDAALPGHTVMGIY